MVERLGARGDLDGHAAECANELTGEANSGGIAFDGEDFSVEARNGDAAEGLEWVHGADGGTTIAKIIEDVGTESAAGVQDDLTAEFFGADAFEFPGDTGDGIIGSRDEDEARGQNVARERCTGFSGADKAGGFTRGRFIAGYHCANFPTQFVQTPSECAADASRTDDRQSATHAMLG